MKNKILLVDDDSVSHFINKRLLEVVGLTEPVAIAFNGKEAIDYITYTFESHQLVPEVIFLDVNMPIMNGFKFIETLRSLTHIPHEQIKIIMLSSSNHERDKQRAQELGVTHYLPKPLSALAISTIFNTEHIEIC